MMQAAARFTLRCTVVALTPRCLSSSAAVRKHEKEASGSSSKPYFDKILVANRGEIACRVMKTAKRLGIKTVAVYSEADAGALHVRLADEAVCIGPAPSTQSYLDVDKIIKAMKDTGAQAVHPGYGFLSENGHFCKRLEEEGLVFIGPPPKAIHAMGDKIESKKLALAAKVNVIPGVNEVIETEDIAVKISQQIGYPVMIKASAGGGGKGMRIAWNDEEAREGFNLSKSEAKASFKDDRVFIEKFIVNPRHIEIQIMADKHGNAIWLNERECSVQRRNQKVLEEAPSVMLDQETRAAMGNQAVALAKAVDYCSAGTVEMVVDENKNFYFLEMNTRLQVEHPVTEYITGLDLVELMIMVAAGEKLPLTQKDVKLDGWAMEVRVYAEDPYHSFLPSIGYLTRYVEPSLENGNVRVDTGVVEGSEISIYYDPLISKLIAYGRDRNEAIDRLKTALDSYVIRGVVNNSPFLRAILSNPRYVSGKITTNFIPEEFPKGFHGYPIDDHQKKQLFAIAAALHVQRQIEENSVLGKNALSGASIDENVVLTYKKESSHAVVKPEPGNSFKVSIGDSSFSLVLDKSRGHGLLDISIDNQHLVLQILNVGFTSITLQFLGSAFTITTLNSLEHQLHSYLPEKHAPDTSKMLFSPMPGVITSLLVHPGDSVSAGQGLLIVEAMKMQNVLRAQRAGKVKDILVKKGDVVAVEQLLLELK